MYKLLLQLFLMLPILSIGQVTISGKVSNNSHENLQSAVVFLKGTEYAVSTDVKGNYIIENLPKGNYNVECSYLGYETISTVIDLQEDLNLNFTMEGDIYDLDQIEIISNRLNIDDAVFAVTNVNKEEIAVSNIGQDVPYLLQWQPSMVVTSDAGNGIGYTGLRIRGTDPSRINVTINGVALNDGESQGVFWVDLPDFLSSVKDIQIQRGVGTSTNGSGAFGGSVSLNTMETNINPYASLSGSYGSFNTNKMTIKAGTGLMNNKYTIDARYSILNSDGYVDRADSDLESWYIAAGKVGQKSSLRLVAFSGHERTYQSWYGTPEAKVNGDNAALLNHYYTNLGSLYNTSADSVNLFSSDRKYNFYTYKDQVDDYRQTHIQLHYSNAHTDKFNSKTTLYYTKGKGFFEQFRFDDDLEDYGLSNITGSDGNIVESTNLVRRRWLNNDLIGLSFTGELTSSDASLFMFGGSIQKYLGGHYGQIIDADLVPDIDIERLYYDNDGNKSDANAFVKWNYSSNDNLTLFVDGQIRTVNYNAEGVDSDLLNVDIKKSYVFFNPKLGVNYNVNKKSSLYTSFSVANREPDRSDFLDNPADNTPDFETLYDLEAGYRFGNECAGFEANGYYMYYNNQLIQTGDLNDVGSVIRTNTPSSYRAGIELSGLLKFSKYLKWMPNITFSQNKIKEFNDVFFDYTNGFERIETKIKNTDIAFSPNIISSSNLVFTPVQNIELSFDTKYVGKQYLDNTSSDAKSIDAYLINNLRATYQNSKVGKGLMVSLMVNNLFNKKYSSNGYTYSYGYQGTITENYLYPQAGTNFILGATIKI